MRNIHDEWQQKRIMDNHAWLLRLDGLIGQMIKDHEYEYAISMVQVCGDFAWRNHPGIFASHRLENQLRKIAESVLPSLNTELPETVGNKDTSKNVIHIMTEAHPVGGSTRLVSGWINNDSSVSHSIVLTAQCVTPVPELLLDAVKLSGGQIYQIDDTPRSKLDSVLHLRSLVSKASLIVLHIHPHDPLALLALQYWTRRPLTVFMNHADHLFWLGAGIADHYLVFRDSGYQICVDRRGIPADRCSVLPIPVHDNSIQILQNEAKKKLGLPEDSILCLTVGFSYKFFTTENNRHLVDIIMPVFEHNKKLRLIAIGPSNEGRWTEGYEQSDGRIQAIGECSCIDLYLAASDIFLMPMPIHSSTAALEAGIQGLPILVYTDPVLCGTVFDANSPGLCKSVITTTTFSEYRESLTRLTDDEVFRRELGAKTQNVVNQYHAKSAWLECLHSALASAKQSVAENDKVDDEPQCQPEDRQLIEIQRGILGRPAFMLARHCDSMPLFKKLYLWWRYFQPLKSFVTKYSIIEITLLLLPPKKILLLRVTFERNTFFRRLFLK